MVDPLAVLAVDTAVEAGTAVGRRPPVEGPEASIRRVDLAAEAHPDQDTRVRRTGGAAEGGRHSQGQVVGTVEDSHPKVATVAMGLGCRSYSWTSSRTRPRRCWAGRQKGLRVVRGMRQPRRAGNRA